MRLLRSAVAGGLLAAALAGCRGTLSPLSNKLRVGEEPYVVFTADGEAGLGDLFASGSAGGTPYQVTFTRVDERDPALSADGALLAFIRSRMPGDSTGAVVAVLNLLSGGERSVAVDSLRLDALAWAPDGRALFLRSGAGLYRSPAPPEPLAFVRVATEELAAADSAFMVLLGDPPIGDATRCPEGAGLCVRTPDGAHSPLARDGAAPAVWLGDSVVYAEQGEWVVRPLGGGKTRVLRWSRPLTNVRSLTVFRGPAMEP